MAKRLPTILPPLNLQEALEVTRLYSISGKLENGGLATTRPFRAPHHTASNISLVGGGGLAQPGEISLAHNGVLFLDELPEFQRKVLEVLRQPLEERQITISRANFNNTYPAGFLFVAAMNPCPCGFFKHPFRKCTCTKHMIRQYVNRISGPLLDRIDLHVPVAPVEYGRLSFSDSEISSNELRKKVTVARLQQDKRHAGYCNAQLTPEKTRQVCKLGRVELEVLQQAMEKHRLSARSYDRILKVARTIADLDQEKTIEMKHLAEAIRIVCNNTLNAALRNHTNCIKIRHTANANDRLKQAHTLMGITGSLGAELEGIFNHWANVRINDKELKQLVQLAMCPNKEVLKNLKDRASDNLSTIYKNGGQRF